MFGRILDVAVEDARRLFDTNFWGVVYGSRAAVQHMVKRGGVLINVASAAADRNIPLQGFYASSKAAVQSFSHALRLELLKDKVPVDVVVIAPSAIDTPIAKHAKNLLDTEARIPPPHYAPEAVARAILACIERPHREIAVGAPGQLLGHLEQWIPSLIDRAMQRYVFDLSKTSGPNHHEGNLYQPLSSLDERGHQARFVFKRSWYTDMRLHPGAVGLVAGAFVTFFALSALKRQRLLSLGV